MADSTHPLTDAERGRLKAAFAKEPDTTRSQLAHVLYSTGMHPACLGNPRRWAMSLSETVLTWRRAKTEQQVSVPIDPDIRDWLGDLVASLEERPIHPVNVAKMVRAFGEAYGLSGLTPRTLRHDYAYRAVQSQGFMAARELTGTTTEILMGYARRQMAEAASRDPKGLFG